MKCSNCKFYHGGFNWNRCDITEGECFYEFIAEPCSIINDDYVFIIDCPEMGFEKGKSALEYLEKVKI